MNTIYLSQSSVSGICSLKSLILSSKTMYCIEGSNYLRCQFEFVRFDLMFLFRFGCLLKMDSANYGCCSHYAPTSESNDPLV